MQESINATAEIDIKEVLQERYDSLAYKLQKQRADYNKFCDDNKLVPQAERMKVAKFSRAEAQRAVWGAKRHEKYTEISDSSAKDRFGVVTNNNKTDSKYYNFKGKGIDTVEAEICKLDYEVGVIFENGKAISCQLGTSDEIRFTKYQTKLMRGKDVTHNHPLSTPPSPEDLYVLVENKANSFRTCGKNGTYVLKYSKAIDSLPDFAVFSDKYDELLQRLHGKYRKKVQSKTITQEEAVIKLGEEIWDELYKEYGVKPEFIRR